MFQFRSKRMHHTSTSIYLQSSPFAPQELPCFFTTMRTSDSRTRSYNRSGSLRFLDFSVLTRCLQPPRGAHRLHTNVASPMAAGFSLSGSIATPTLRNEAESSSLYYGSRVRLIGLHLGDYSFQCQFDYMLDIQLTRQLPFKLIEKSGLA